MANVYNPKVCEVALVFENNADATRAHNILHFVNINDVAVGMMEDLATEIETWVDVEWQPLASVVWKCVGLRMRQLKETAPAVYDTAFSYTGAIAGAAPANNVTFAMSLRTGLGGRSYRGRLYHVGLAEADVTNSYLDNTVIASMIEAYEALITVGNTLDFDWCVYSKFTNGAPRATGLATKITSVIAVDNVTDSMRSRLPAH